MKLKKILALLLALMMVLGTMSIAVFAEDTATALSYFTYTQDDTAKTVTLTKYNDSATEVVVPGTYDIEVTDDEGNITTATYAVIIDSTTTFANNTNITKVTLKEGVKFANNSMKKLFYNCSKLGTVDWAEISTTGITDMSYIFFNTGGSNKNTALKTVDFSNFDTSSVTTLEGLFQYCTAVEVTGYENFETSKVESIYYTFTDVNNEFI
ncbi:MAG: BspA family leucine-rich repeat surface protein, partial [Oscillospiraceae bacterium]|nr:BspA family leucine-rich repeat surface protein [Oscillospiraceae bacterium]